MIKKYEEFIKESEVEILRKKMERRNIIIDDLLDESISGTELVGPVGPAYGETGLQNKTVTAHDTNEIFCDLDNKFYNIDDYNNIYQDYLKVGGKPLDGFNLDNIITIITFKGINQ